MSLLAHTKSIYNTQPLLESWKLEYEAHCAKYTDTPHIIPCAQTSTHHQHQLNIPRHLQWSQDGTSITSVHEDHGIRVFLLDQDLMSHDNEQTLVPINRVLRNSPIIAHSQNPTFSLFNDSGNDILVSQRGVPLKLIDLTPFEEPVLQSYRLEDQRHDRLLDVTAISYTASNQFVCGATNTLAIFDLDRTEPIAEYRIPGTGIVSHISESTSDSIHSCLYFGNYTTNEIQVLNPKSSEIVMQIKLQQGNGVTQVIESNNGRYLYAISRFANEIPVLDIRMDLQQVATLRNWQPATSPAANKNQKIFADKLHDGKGVVAGTNDGKIKIWGGAEFGIDCDAETLLSLGIDDTVTCVTAHPARDDNILGISTGSRNFKDESHSGIGIWDINALTI